MFMKEILFSAILLLSFSVLTAVPNTDFQMAPDGSFQVDELSFALQVRNPKWSSTKQNSQTIRPASGFPRTDSKQFHLQGSFQVTNGVFEVEENLVSASPDGVLRYQVRLSASKALECAELCLGTNLPISRFLNRPIRFDGKTVNFGKEYCPEKWVVDRNVKRIEIPIRAGTLYLEGDLKVRFQDNRRYSRDGAWELRILLSPRSGTVRKASLQMNMRIVRPFSKPLDLSSAANMGFADPAAEDQTGGWTDQGPDNDLRMFPRGNRQFAGIPFRIPGPEENGGKAVIALRGAERPYFPASANLTVPPKTRANYLWILHALGWEPQKQQEIGTITVEYENDGFTEHDVQQFPIRSGIDIGNFWNPRKLPNAAIAWKGHNASAEIGVYASRIKLSGKNISRIHFASNGTAVWLIAGVTLSDKEGSAVLEEKIHPLVINAGPDWIPVARRTNVVPGSVLDLSELLHCPAGKYGYLRNVNGKFEFKGRPGICTRFYGVNIAFMLNFMEPKQTDQLVERLSRSGYNLLRLHHFDDLLTESPHRGTSPFVKERLNRFHYLISRCREAGIYITLDLYTCREPDASISRLVQGETISGSEYKALFFLDEGIRNDFFTFSSRLLNSVNPYTGVALKDDPAICMLSFLNEDTIFATAKRTPRVAALYEAQYKVWQKKNGLIVTKENRNTLWREFLSEIYRKGFAAMRQFAKENGLKMPLTDQNYWTDIGTSLLRTSYEYIDNHFYWAHPSFLGKNWQLPMRFETRSAIRNFAGGISEQFPCREFGKPYSVSEWNYCHPNRYNLEGGFLMGAYSALQDWSSLCRFAFSHTIRSLDDRSLVTTLDIAEDPVRTLSEIAAQMFFLRGDVSPSKNEYMVLMEPTHWKNPRAPSGFPLYMRRLGLIGKTGFRIVLPGGMNELPENSRLLVGSEQLRKRLAGNKKILAWNLNVNDSMKELVREKLIPADDAARNRFRSDTGELLLDCDQTAFLVSTPRSEGMVLEKNSVMEGKFTKIRNHDTFAGFLITSKDGSPLQQSNRLLILHLTGIANTGETYRDTDCNILESWGHAPLLLRRNKAELTLNRTFRDFHLYKVDPNGKRISETPFRIRDGKTILLLDNSENGHAILAYELIKQTKSSSRAAEVVR